MAIVGLIVLLGSVGVFGYSVYELKKDAILKGQEIALLKSRTDKNNTQESKELALKIVQNFQLLGFQANTLILIYIVTFIFFLLSIWLTISGFYLWYVRIQKPMDEMLMKQTKE